MKVKNYAEFVDRYAKWMILGLILVTAGFGYGVSKIRFARMIDDSTLPASNDMVRKLQSVRQTFGDNTRYVIISVESKTGKKVTAGPYLKFIDDLSKGMQVMSSVKRGTTISLTNTKDLELINDELVSDPIINKFPINERQQKTLEKKLAENNFVYGRLISQDFTSALVISSVYTDTDVTVVHDEVNALLEKLKPQLPDVKLAVVGEPAISYSLFTNVEHDIFVFVGAAILLIFISFYFIFRSLAGLFLPLTAILMAVTWTMGLIGYWGTEITIMSGVMPIVLLVVGSSFAIHVYHNLAHENLTHNTFADMFNTVMRKLFSPLLLAALTTFIGSITLLAFKIGPIRHFGLFSAIGALFCLIATITAIPALFRIFYEKLSPAARVALNAVDQPPKSFLGNFTPDRLFDKVLPKVAQLSVKFPYLILLGMVVMMTVATHFASKVEIGLDNRDFLPKGDPIRTAAIRLDKVFGGTNTFEVVVDTRKENGLLNRDVLESILGFEDKASRIAEVTHSFSFVHLLEKIHATLKPGSLEHLPEGPDSMAQYLLLLGMADGTGIKNMVTSDYSKAKISLTVNVSDSVDTQRVYDQLTALSSEHFSKDVEVLYAGQTVFVVSLMRYLIWGKIQNLLLSMLLIMLIVMLRYRSLTRGLITVLPLPIGVIANFGLMGYLGIRLDFITSITTSFAMGIGIDFSIHFVAAVRRSYKQHKNIDQAIKTAISGPGRAIIYNAVCCVAGFSVPMLSQFHAINTFAVLICFNMIVLCIATFLLLPATVKIFSPMFITDKQPSFQDPIRQKVMFGAKVAFSSGVMIALAVGIVIAEGMS